MADVLQNERENRKQELEAWGYDVRDNGEVMRVLCPQCGVEWVVETFGGMKYRTMYSLLCHSLAHGRRVR